VQVVASGPTIEFTADPDSIAPGGTAVLTWSAGDADSCAGSGGWSGPKDISGTEQVGPFDASAAFTLSCSGPSGSSQQTVIVTVNDPAQSNDFGARCSAPGVIKCIGFDEAADFGAGNLLPAFDNVVRGEMDTNIKASGAGSLRFEIPGRSAANAAGAWFDTLGRQFGPGDRFYLQFRQRFSSDMLEIDYAPGGGWKQIIIYGNASCGAVELTTFNAWLQGFPEMYTDCGARPFHEQLGGGDVLLQQGDYNCRYQSSRPPEECGYYHADEWMTFYYEIELGPWNQPGSNIRAYMAYEGEPLKQFIDMRNYTLHYDSDPSDTYKSILLTTYMTGKDASQDHPSTYTWYDELIVSTEPIPGPIGVVPPPAISPPNVVLTASPESVTQGGTAELVWSVTDADSCTASGGWSGARGLSGSEIVGPLDQTGSFSLACVNAVGDSGIGVVQVSVEGSIDAPQIEFYADPESVEIGQNSTLHWSVSNADQCIAEGAWAGDKPLVGNEQIWLDHDVTYILTCEGPGGTGSKGVTVQVVTAGAPIVMLEASPETVPAGDSMTLSWDTQNATSCQASGDWTGTRPLSGSETFSPVMQNSSFMLICEGPGGSSQQVVNVTVQADEIPGEDEPPVSGSGDSASSSSADESATDSDSDSSGGSSATHVLELLLLLIVAVSLRIRSRSRIF
jgi:hypothetical protein